jgi:hypothetical protein
MEHLVEMDMMEEGVVQASSYSKFHQVDLLAQDIYSIKIEAYIEYINSKKEILWN